MCTSASRLLSLVGWAAFLFFLAGCGDESKQAGQLPQVTYIEMQAIPTALSTELTGRTSAFQLAEIRPQVGGIIQRRLFTEGAYVEAGEVLYQIDPALYEAAVHSAKAALLQAQANAHAAGLLADRYKKLLPSKAVSRQEYDDAYAAARQAEASVAAAQASLDTASINLGYTRVISPISGVIGRSSVTQGALVSAQQSMPLATVHQLSPIYVDVTQSSTEFLRLKQTIKAGKLSSSKLEGAEAVLFLPDGSLYAEKGTLLFSEATVDAGTGSYTIRAEFPNADKTLLQNLFIRLRITSAVSEEAVLIPQRCVSRDAKGDPFVMVLTLKSWSDPSKKPQLPAPDMDIFEAHPRPIVTAQAQGNQWVVIEGLLPGEKVLLDGGMKLMQGRNMVVGTLAQTASAAEPMSEKSTNSSTSSPAQ